MQMKRQTILLATLVGLVVVAIGWNVGKKMFYDPFQADQERIISLDSRLNTLRLAQTVQQPTVRKQWIELAGNTLSINPTETKNVLTKELTRLTMIHKLVKPRIQSPRFKPDKKTGVITLPASVTAQGTLKNVTGFLGAVYELPYMVRVREIRMSPVGTRNSTTVSMAVKLETLVLPRNDDNKSFLPKEVATIDLGDDPKNSPRREPVVLAKAVDAYGAMDARKPFHGFRPIPKPASRPSLCGRIRLGSRGRKPPVKKPPPPPPDPRGYTIVSTVLEWRGNLEVGLTDNRTKGRVFFKVGDELILRDTKNKPYNEGKIVLIHAYGVVTQAENGQRKMYSTGKPVAQPQPINDSTDPTILAALAALGGT